MSVSAASARYASAAAPIPAHRLRRSATNTGRWKSIRVPSKPHVDLHPTKQKRFRRAASAAAPSSTSDSGAVPAQSKVCVITGANTGLGFVSAEAIAKKPGYVVVLACRNMAKAEKAAAAILASTGRAVDVMQVDLSELGSVEAFVREFTVGWGQVQHCKRPKHHRATSVFRSSRARAGRLGSNVDDTTVKKSSFKVYPGFRV